MTAVLFCSCSLKNMSYGWLTSCRLRSCECVKPFWAPRCFLQTHPHCNTSRVLTENRSGRRWLKVVNRIHRLNKQEEDIQTGMQSALFIWCLVRFSRNTKYSNPQCSAAYRHAVVMESHKNRGEKVQAENRQRVFPLTVFLPAAVMICNMRSYISDWDSYNSVWHKTFPPKHNDSKALLWEATLILAKHTAVLNITSSHFDKHKSVQWWNLGDKSWEIKYCSCLHNTVICVKLHRSQKKYN